MNAEHFACTNAEYHDSPGISNSMVKVARKNLELFKGRFITKTIPHKPTKEMNFGDAAHKIILNDDEVTIIPDGILGKGDKRNTKKWYAYEKEHVGETLITKAQQRQIEEMKAVLLANPIAAKFLTDAEAHREYAIRWTDPETEMLLRCKPDILIRASCIPDLKTAASCDPEAFAIQAIRLGYHRQAVFYPMGVEDFTGKKLPMVFIVQEREPPYTVELIDLSKKFLERGLREIRKALAMIQEAGVYDRYRSPTWGQITTVDEPRWAKYEDEYELEQETEQ